MASSPTGEQISLFKQYACQDCGTAGLDGAYNRGGSRTLRCDPCRSRIAVLRATEWKRANPEKIVAITHDRYRRKRQQMKAAAERWRVNNPDKVRDIREARRARERGAFVEHVDRVVVWDAYEGCCGICRNPVGLDEMELDHIVPLSRGGLHQYANCQPSHMVCNRRKHNRLEA